MIEKAESVILPDSSQFGFCEGVVSADKFLGDITKIAQEYGVMTVYGYHDIVHNSIVKAQHEKNGVVFIDDVSEVPAGSIVVGSAHGSSPVIPYNIEKEGGIFFDGACPLVIHTHNAVKTARREDEKVLYLLSGKPNVTSKIHDEVNGTVGHMDYYFDDNGIHFDPVPRSYIEITDNPAEIKDLLDEDKRYRIISQTTLLATVTLEFREFLANYIANNQEGASIKRIASKDVCAAVDQRQEGVRVLLSEKPDVIMVVTDINSKNGMGYFNQAREIIHDEGLLTEAVQVATIDDLDVIRGAMKGRKVAVTASASTPDTVTRSVVESIGGDPQLVPSDRPSFILKGSKIEDIKSRIKNWYNS